MRNNGVKSQYSIYRIASAGVGRSSNPGMARKVRAAGGGRRTGMIRSTTAVCVQGMICRLWAANLTRLCKPSCFEPIVECRYLTPLLPHETRYGGSVRASNVSPSSPRGRFNGTATIPRGDAHAPGMELARLADHIGSPRSIGAMGLVILVPTGEGVVGLVEKELLETHCLGVAIT